MPNLSGFGGQTNGIITHGVETKVSCNRAAVLFLLDESGSMEDSITSLNNAINRFPKDVLATNNTFAKTNIEVAVMAFSSSVRVVSDWRQLGSFSPVALSANGGTNLQTVLKAALEKVRAKLQSGTCNIAHIVLVSDGYGGDVASAAKEISQMKREGKLVFWMLGVPGYDTNTAQILTGGERLYLLSGKQFSYTDFIKMIGEAVVRPNGGGQKPVVQKPREPKRFSFGSNHGDGR